MAPSDLRISVSARLVMGRDSAGLSQAAWQAVSTFPSPHRGPRAPVHPGGGSAQTSRELFRPNIRL